MFHDHEKPARKSHATQDLPLRGALLPSSRRAHRAEQEAVMSLSDLTCKPPRAGDVPLSPKQAELARQEVPAWTLDGAAIRRDFPFCTFLDAMGFVNQVAAVAEEQGHHPDIFVSYKTVRLTLSTHRIGGLSINDFIVAARIDRLPALQSVDAG